MSRQRYPERPYPSFTLIMSQINYYPTLRLPNYRTAHRERYHPYPRTKLQTAETIDIMQSFDTQILISDLATVYSSTSNPITSSPNLDNKESEEDCSEDVASSLRNALTSTSTEEGKGWRSLKMTTAVIDLALTVRRRCSNITVRAVTKRSSLLKIDTLD